MSNEFRPVPEPWGEDPEGRLDVREENFQAGSSWTHGDDIKLRKWVQSEPFYQEFNRDAEELDADHVPPEPGDDGEVHELADGTLSIPVFEEQIVVTRRTVVRERVLLRRQIVAETVQVNEEVRREQFELESRDGEEIDVQPRGGHTAPFPGSSADPRRRRSG